VEAGKSRKTKSRGGGKADRAEANQSSTYKLPLFLNAKYNQDLLVPKFLFPLCLSTSSHGFKHIFTLKRTFVPSIGLSQRQQHAENGTKGAACRHKGRSLEVNIDDLCSMQQGEDPQDDDETGVTDVGKKVRMGRLPGGFGCGSLY
jgi:hypothetical protein